MVALLPGPSTCFACRSVQSRPIRKIAITLRDAKQARAQQFVAIGAALPNGEFVSGRCCWTGPDNTPGASIRTRCHSAANTTGFNTKRSRGFDARGD